MRQADSTIKGYLYQFNKSIDEILSSADNDVITVEGVIEDIDIQSPSGTTTIQCKYHEDSKYQISSVAPPILEMLCHYCESAYLGRSVSYVLYAYYSDNVDKVDMASFVDFLQSTKDKDILCKYFHRIYTIPDTKILNIANKQKKNKGEKEDLINYYKSNRTSLSMRVNISDFWHTFTYVKAKQFDILKEEVVQQLSAISDRDTALSLFYPNAFSVIASMSAKNDIAERKITKAALITILKEHKSLLINRWTLEALGKEKILKAKRRYLSSHFSSNADIRAFVFTDTFLDRNANETIALIHEYLNKYFKKPKLQKPPIFVFGSKHSDLMQSALIELYKYQRSVNTGFVGNTFVEDSFIYNRNCPPDFSCKMAVLKNITVNTLEQCQVNQVYIIGKNESGGLHSVNFYTEELDVADINAVRYLIALSTTLEA